MNYFAEIGLSQHDVDAKIADAFHTIFFDPTEKIYFEHGPDMGFFLDTGNNDARSEGMSYGMMMAVQMNRQDLFDRLWLFSKTYMHQTTGKYTGYFAWSVTTEGAHNAEGPAPDGEEFFAMALFFAEARWGGREAPFDYAAQARDILRHCLHQPELAPDGDAMWEPDNHLIRFVPEARFSDPSYHCPHFYSLFAHWADEGDRDFWREAAAASRAYIVRSCHPVTGMASEYAEYDGTPRRMHHDGQYYSDAYRVILNIALDTTWNGEQPGYADIADRLQAFFSKNTTLLNYHNYMVDGTPLAGPALHPYAIVATNAAGSVASTGAYRLDWLRDFWALPLRKGERRYYDNCLHFFCLLILGGRYNRIYL